MIVLLSEKYGKISAGTSISEKGKNKTALALRPFTKGRYELFKNKETYNINGAETMESFFSLGEDVDKYMIASYALELTDLMLEEGQSAIRAIRLARENGHKMLINTGRCFQNVEKRFTDIGFDVYVFRNIYWFERNYFYVYWVY